MSKTIKNDVTGGWVKSLTPLEYDSEDHALAMDDAVANAISADLSTGESLFEREHPVPAQPHSTHVHTQHPPR